MQTLLTQITVFLIQPPGNLVYHLALCCSLVAALQSTLVIRHVNPSSTGHRTTNGISILLAAQLGLFILSAVTWQGQNSLQFLPPLNRAIIAFSIIWGVWLWAFPEPSRTADTGTWMASLAIMILFLFTNYSWQPSVNPNFNQTWLDLSWTILILFLSVSGIALIAIRRKSGWISGLFFTSLLTFGTALHLIFGFPNSDYAGAIRITQVIAYPFLIGLAIIPGHDLPKPDKDIEDLQAEPLRPAGLDSDDPSSTLIADSDETPQFTIRQLREEIATLRLALDSARASAIQAQPVDLAALVALQQESDSTIAQLESENARLQAALETLSHSEVHPSGVVPEDELRISRQRVAELEVLVDQLHTRLAQQRAIEERELAGQATSDIVPELIRDLRQPVSAIFGYIDLLLGDTAGILGASQRHYIERIKSSMERVLTILDELSHASAKEPAGFSISALLLPELIDQATSKTAPLFRAKALSLRIQVTPGLPPVEADRSAILQVLVALMKHAADASPYGGIVRFQAETQMFEKERYLLVKITDSSGGMGQDSVSSFFARRPLSAKNISQDKATEDGSLMIAKSLVDAHGGRIWAESQLGSATTLFLLLPTKSPFSKSNPDK